VVRKMKTGRVVINKLRKRQGSAIAYVLLILVLVSISSMLVLSLFASNFKLATHQERSTEAYYLAYSGAELAFAALAADSNQIFNQLVANPSTSRNQTLTLENGTVVVSARQVTAGSPYYTMYPGWIMITSTGTLNRDNTARTRILLVDNTDQQNLVWK
jgi:uncharacterized membrane protein